MTRLVTARSAALALLLGGPALSADITEVALKAKPSVVHLEVLSSSGEVMGNATGFFISEDGLVATNFHVIAEAAGLKARLADGSTRAILGVMAESQQRDLAILKAEGGGFPALALADSEQVREGLKVATWGSPVGLAFTLSEGTVSALRPNGLPEEHAQGVTYGKTGPIIQINAPGASGSSGSPVIAETGQVIAVVQSGIGGQGTLQFGIPSNDLAKLRSSITAGAQPRSLSPVPWLNAGISAVLIGAFAGWFLLERLRKRRQVAAAISGDLARLRRMK
jgi:S1-C subfamily serine protease